MTNNTNKQITIDFKNHLCNFSELKEFFQNINWELFSEGNILYYSSHSANYFYNFKIEEITDNNISLVTV